MEVMKNLRWMCRLCAVNIKRKRTISSSMPIFGLAPLNGKLKKYLDISVEPNDALPKSICFGCYKKLEMVHSFALLAKKTEKSLMEFIGMSHSNITLAEASSRFQSEFASFAYFSSEKGKGTLNQKRRGGNGALSGNIKLNVGSYQAPQQNSNNSTKSSRAYNILASNSNRDSLEQKRRNLKALLVNNNAQSPAQTSGHTVSSQRSAIFETNNPYLKITQVPVTNVKQNAQKNSAIYDDRLILGRVIRDMDLLKLILKALKWPYTNENLLVQIQRLKDTPFRDVILDQNLLQDTDLMQILNTYLSPILLQQQSAPPPLLPSLVSYKIPADLSVHIITEELEEDPPRPPVAKKPKRRYNRAIIPKVVRSSSPIVIPSDDDSIQMFEVSIDPSLYFARENETPENSNSSETHRKNREAEQFTEMRRKHKRKEPHSKVHSEKICAVEAIPQPSKIITPKKIKTENPTENIDTNDVATGEIKTENVVAVDNISGDDAIWSEFKVFESPDNSLTQTEKTISSVKIKTEPDSVPDDFIIMPTHENVISQENLEIKDDEIKQEVVEVEKEEVVIQSVPVEDPKIEEKETPIRRGRKRKTTSPAARSAVLQASSTLLKSTGNNQQTKPIKSKSPTNETIVIPRKSERKVAAAAAATKSTTNRKITRSVSAAPPVMSLRNSNLRKRICKQCGLSFTKLNDFLDHRKMHINS